MARILITGGKGMLGRTLAKEFSGDTVFAADLPGTDILDRESLAKAFAEFRPDAVVHCAAMTKVDDCETSREFAFALNGEGSANVAAECAKCGARLVAISTDYVFSGDKASPYRETDEPAPRTVYGASKLAGERAVLSAIPAAAVLRIAWLYGSGGPSFLHTMARLGSQEGPDLKVVADQRGNPTSAVAVAKAVRFLLEHRDICGIVHGTCRGVCSWYGFAAEIFRLLGLNRGLVPCGTAEFPRPAPRPANSALDNTVLEAHGFFMPEWKDALAEFAASEFPAAAEGVSNG